ncbi:MAG: OmpW family outer membrane protein [Thermodesulfobacteriota bacterium]|nr:OmpW family outer membrane protein [Thermodesulfobacteriota bacterium]
MTKRVLMIMFAILICLSIVPFAKGETLFGKNYVGGAFGIVKFGDDTLDEILGNGYGFNAGGNINLNKNIDLLLDVGYVWADGDADGFEVDLSGLAAGAKLNYFFKPDEKANPFIGAGIAVVKSEVEVSGFGAVEEDDETDVGFSVDAGVELEFTEEVLFRFGLDYFNINDEDSIDGSVSFGYWFNKQIMGAISGSYDFDDGDAAAQIGLIVPPSLNMVEARRQARATNP